MEGAGREDQGSDGRRLRVRFGVIAGLIALGLVFGVAPTVGDGLNRQAEIAPAPAVGTVPATEAQVVAGNIAANGAVLSAAKKKQSKVKLITIQSRITDSETPILTEEGKGSYVRLVCPDGAVAVSGGMLTSFINLVISSSGPNNPISGAYTPRTWWVTAVNSNVDGQGGTLGWRGIVNCMSPVKLKK
ncbi:MAG: hypothetical protein JJE13_04670 [Thermoleophilia bacterium]|nr:hypothetical protein [Thermoleophilia bacterium]